MLTTLHKKFATDRRKEEEGVWHDMGDGSRIKVARVGNPRYTRLLTERSRPHQRAATLNTLSEDVAQRIVTEVEGRTVLVDWEGMCDAAGNSLPYSCETAQKLLVDLPEFRRFVLDLAGDVSYYRPDPDTDPADDAEEAAAA